MGKYLFFVLAVICGITCNPAFSQQNKTTKEQQQYFTSYEKSTLVGNDLPVLMPYNRWIVPAGVQLYFGDKELENHALDCAISPDGRWIAVEGRYSIVILNPESKKIINRFVLKSHFGAEDPMNTFSGISWRKTGAGYELYWSTVGKNNKSYVVQAEWNGKKIEVLKTFLFEAIKPAVAALPNELLVVEESGFPMLYVVLNGNNTVEKIDINSGKPIWSVPSGIAPFGIASANGKLYVTNWAGSIPDKEDVNVAGIPWGSAKVDPETGATREGTVSVFDPQTGSHLKEITVGLHPNDIIASKDGKIIYVANGNSDMVSVINTVKDEVAEQISVRLLQEKNSYFGDSPNGLGLT